MSKNHKLKVKKRNNQNMFDESEENIMPDFLLVGNDKNMGRKGKGTNKLNSKSSSTCTVSKQRKISNASKNIVKRKSISKDIMNTRKIEDLFNLMNHTPAKTVDKMLKESNVSRKKIHKDKRGRIEDPVNDSETDTITSEENSTVQKFKKKQLSPIKSTNIDDLFDTTNTSLNVEIFDETNNNALASENNEICVPNNITHSILQHFSDMSIPNNTMSVINLCCSDFWQQTLNTLSTFAKHAGRNTITTADIELLLYRQGYVQDRNSINDLISKYLPLEMAMDVLPIAKAKNNV